MIRTRFLKQRHVEEGLISGTYKSMYIDQRAVKSIIKEHLSASLQPRPKKTRHSLKQEKAQVIEIVKNKVQETIKKVDLEKIIVEKIESIDWQEKIKEAVGLSLKMIRGVVE